MKIYLVRHGLTNYNELGLSNSDPSKDVHLTKKGIEQAKRLSKKLEKIDFDVIFISELKRTKQTAEIINLHHKIPLKVDARLNDVKTGFEDVHYLVYHEALDSVDNRWTVRFNDGESQEDLKKRVESFIQELTQKKYKTVLIVTSMVIIQEFYGIVNKLTYEQAWDMPVPQGSCIEVDL